MERANIISLLIITFILFSSWITEVNATIDERYHSISATEEDMNISTNKIAVLETNYGVIKFVLYEKRAPISSENFIKLAEEHFYDGIKFHRIIDDFVIQTGDPNSKDDNPYDDGRGGSDETIPLEIHPELTHIDGAVGMARGTEENSASSQFYICDGEQHQLDGDYAVFGITIEGMEVVREIAQAETYPDYRVALKDHPVDDIIMLSVYIEEPEIVLNESAVTDESDDIKGPESNLLPGFETPFTIMAMASIAAVILFSKKNLMQKNNP